MPHAILGTAGHIDHGKTALVRALTGVDTDRLPEEKARGITIDLGFAELALDGGVRMGVVDVPGHEDLIRTMVAGATGMDVVLAVIAADEGIMPQTIEHLDIVRILDVPRLVVALTKADLVDAEWLAMVEEEVGGYLAGTAYAGSPVVPTSIVDGRGLDALRRRLSGAMAGARPRDEADWVRLPVDRSFTVAGMGTVATGTLWSGTLSVGERVRVLPGATEGRIRSLQVHGRDARTARASERTAVALAGVERGAVARGQVLVTADSWTPGAMLTVEARLLPGAGRALAHGSRVRVLHGTAEVMARCAILDGRRALEPGEAGWAQLRLEAPVLARAGDRLVIRSYSPPMTLGGGTVVEPCPGKRRRVDATEAEALRSLSAGTPAARVASVLALAGWRGAAVSLLPQTAGVPPAAVEAALREAEGAGALRVRGLAFAPGVADEAAHLVGDALDRAHVDEPLRPTAPLDRLRASLPRWAGPGLADAVLQRMVERGEAELGQGGALRPGFRATPSPEQLEACRALRTVYLDAGLAPPFVAELPEGLATRPDLGQLLRFLEAEGTLKTVDDGLLVAAETLESAAEAITAALGGRTGLGPADFRDVLPVSRRHLMPLLSHFDGVGVTVRRGPVRDVPPGG